MKGKPMLWNLFLVLSIGLVVWPALALSGSTERNRRENFVFLTALASAVFISMLIASIIGSATQSYNVSKYKRSGELVNMKREQRDQLAAIVRKELSNEQFAQLMAATPSVDVLVILGNHASAIMVERSRQLVALNSELYVMVNELAEKRIDLCSYADNLFTPRLFFGLKCPKAIPLNINT